MPTPPPREVIELVTNQRLYSYSECIRAERLIPHAAGVYAWFFREVPQGVPLTDTMERDGLRLLYVGISPKPPTKAGSASKQTIRTRIRYHFRGNAEGSTLRKTLGCLLAAQLEIHLQIVGESGSRRTFGKSGEEKLSDWLAENARVAWLTHPRPWEVEHAAIKSLSLPLNLRDNDNHPFHPQLTRIRHAAKLAARRVE